jgi:hypothetical protein
MATIIDQKTFPQTAPVSLNLHLVATLEVSADDARRLVNHQVVPELGTGLVAQSPTLVLTETCILWRVPVVLSLSTLDDLGQVGVVDVDARTGELLLSAEARKRIIAHASRLYAGATALPNATLSAE